MFKDFSDFVKNIIEYKKASKHPIYSMAMKASQNALQELGLDPLIKKKSPALIARANDLHLMINSVIESRNQIATLRNLYATSVVTMAKFLVMKLEPKPKKDLSNMRGQQGVSGELSKHLVKISKVDKAIRDDIYGTPQAPDVITNIYMKDWVEGKYRLLFWYFRTLDAVRFAINDYNKNIKNDWGKPCLHAACVFEEYQLRNILKLKQKVDAGVAAAYSTFTLNFVLECEKYPDLTFRDTYADQIKDKSIILPKF